jgi:hypothetical protein
MRPASPTSSGAATTVAPSSIARAAESLALAVRTYTCQFERHALLLGPQAVARGDVPSVLLEERVRLAGPHGLVVAPQPKSVW